MIRQGGRRGKYWGSLVCDAHSAPSRQPLQEATRRGHEVLCSIAPSLAPFALPPTPALRPTTVELNQDQLASLWLSHGIWDVKCKPAQPFLRLRGAGINSSTCLPLIQEVWLPGCILRDNHSNVHSCIYKDAYHNIVYDGEKPENIYMSINRGLIK